MLNRNVLKRAATVAAGNLFVGGLLFLAAGTWNHFYAWVFVVTLFIVDLTGIPFLSPELLAERGKKKSDAEKWDIALTRWIVISSMSIFTVSGLDYRFFSNVVRIQYDRGQTVVTGGPYKYIRHPGYSGMILYYLAVPVFLGSLWALIPGILTAVLFVIRTRLEDRTLLEKLDGYPDYALRTRYRLIPKIW
jgi:protein-S-isoprenylcysteine O-methyltransferase Ste14